MNKRIVRIFLASLALVLGSLACAVGPAAAPTPGPTTNSNPNPPQNQAPATLTSAPVLAPTDTVVLDMETILANNGFERNKALDSGCGTACNAYKNSTVNVIADYYYTNKSFSLLYYAKDMNGANEQAEAAVVSQLLAQLYPGTLSSDVMAIVNDFPNHLGNSHGIAGNYAWSITVKVTYNLDKTIKLGTIYIGITPG